MSQDRRLDKVEAALTPQQAVLHWMEEAHEHGSLLAYSLWLVDQADSAYPLVKMPRQVADAVRKQMKGHEREEIDRIIRLRQRDVLFLFHLHFLTNTHVYQRLEPLRYRLHLLAEKQDRMLSEERLRQRATWARLDMEASLPYPLDPDTHATVQVARRHGVETWELLQESEVLEHWVTEQFVREGKTQLPYGSYLTFADPATVPAVSYALPSVAEVRACFGDEEALLAFTDLGDYTYNLADVPDQEFEARLEALEAALRGLLAAGEVRAGKLVRLDSVPHELLREATLVKGEWIDGYVLELAEWGTLLKKRGCELLHAEDEHALAWDRILRQGEPVPEEEGRSMLTEACRHLEKFSGRRQMIAGRENLHFSDYARWRRRWLKGDLQRKVSEGFVRASWNAWVEANGGQGVAELAGVLVEPIHDYGHDHQLKCCRDREETAEEAAARRRLLRQLRRLPSRADGQEEDERDWDRLTEWQTELRALSFEVRSLQAAAEGLSARYFLGRPLLYPTLKDALEAVGSVVDFLDGEAGGQPRLTKTDRPMEVTEASAPGTDLVTYLMDMAKADTLKKLGERAKAEGIIERHLRSL